MENSTFRSCPTHCCPEHGCKYGYDGCPVDSGEIQPVYSNNNGCEDCEYDPPESKIVKIVESWPLTKTVTDRDFIGQVETVNRILHFWDDGTVTWDM